MRRTNMNDPAEHDSALVGLALNQMREEGKIWFRDHSDAEVLELMALLDAAGPPREVEEFLAIVGKYLEEHPGRPVPLTAPVQKQPSGV